MMGFFMVNKSAINSYEVSSVMYGEVYGKKQTHIFTTNGEIMYTDLSVEEVLELIRESRAENEGRV